MADCNRNSKSNVAIGIRMDTKIEARASEQGADEALKTLYGRVGIGGHGISIVDGLGCLRLGIVRSGLRGEQWLIIA